MNILINIILKFKILGKLFITTSFIIMLTGFFKTLLGILLSNLIDIAIYDNTETNIFTFLFIFLSLIIYLFFNAFGKKQFGKLISLGEKDLYTQSIGRLIKTRYTDIHNLQMGEILNRFTEDCSEFINSMSDLLKRSLSTSLNMIIVLIILLFICWPLALYAFFVPIFYNVWFLRFSENIQYVNRKEREQMSILTAYFVDCIKGQMEAFIFKTTQHMREHSKSLLLDRDESEHKKAKFWSIISISDSLMSNIYLLSIIVFGILLVEHNWITWGKILLFLTLSPTFLNFIWDLDPQSFRRAIVASERIQWFWDLTLERIDGDRLCWKVNSPVIQCVNLSYIYPNTSHPVLKDINLNIPAGNSIAIIGRNGSGKTTLLNILCGLIHGYQGGLNFGGHPLEEWNLEALHEGVCYMKQTTILYDDSLLFNITLGKNNDSPEILQEKHIFNILDQVGLLYLANTPQKLQIKIKTLSDGERQRIALARCIYKNAPLWVLDEPTNALDPLTEKLISAYIQKMHIEGKTIITVSHRVAVIENFDYFYILDEGKLIEHGTIDVLLHNSHIFQQYFSSTMDIR